MSVERTVATSSRSRGKIALLAVVTMLMSLVIGLAGLEAALTWTGFRVPKDPYLSFGTVPDFFVRKTVNGQDVYQVAHRDIYSERATTFTAKKAPNTIRILCFGASASAGWPHQGDEIYTVYLERALQQAFPGRHIEVLNLSAHAYAAYRVRLIFEEALQFEPDAVVIWSGNNEFLERRRYETLPRWVEPVAALANESLIYRGVRGSRVGRVLWPENTLSAHERGHHLFTLWSKLEQVAVTLRTDPDQFRGVVRHYAASLEAMVAMAERQGVPVILATVPVNLREWRPAVSCHGAQGNALDQWQGRYHEGLRALAQKDFQTAEVGLRQAIALDPQYADTYFFLGRVLEGRGDFTGAGRQYGLARDADCNPFRAISQFAGIVREIAARHPRTTLADLEQEFAAASAPRSPGFDLFLDHVHPTKKGNLVAAQTVFRALIRAGILGASSAPVPFSVPESLDVHTGLPYDDWTDAPMQALLVRFYMAQHQDESIVERARYLLGHPQLASRLPEADREFLARAETTFAGILARQDDWVWGRRGDPREDNRAQLTEFYKEVFEGYEEFKQKYGASSTP